MARRSTWWVRVSVAAAVLAGGVMAPVVAAVHLGVDGGSPVVDGLEPVPFDKLVETAVGARVAWGFRADPSYVGGLVTRQRLGDGSVELVTGLPFTRAEAAELETRDTLRASVGSIGSYGSAHPDSYAGVYLDPTNGTVVARFTRDLDVHRAQLAAAFVLPERLRVTHARWTVQEMSTASQKVIDEGPTLTALGAQFIGVGASPISNDVRVIVSEITPDVAGYFATNFPPGLIDLRAGGPAIADAGR